MTRQEYAAHSGLSQGYLSKLVHRGIILEDAHTGIDPGQADTARRAFVAPRMPPIPRQPIPQRPAVSPAHRRVTRLAEHLHSRVMALCRVRFSDDADPALVRVLCLTVAREALKAWQAQEE